MMRTIHLTVTCVVAVFTFCGTSATAAPIVTGVSFTTNGTAGHADSKNRMIGWQFTVGPDPIEVTELGFQDFGLNGLAASHEVGIWRLSDESLINSVVVSSGTSDALDGFFRYASLASPSTLISGTTYVISGFDNGTDPHVWDAQISGFPNGDVTGFSVNSAITIGAVGTAHGPFQGSFGFPVDTEIGDARSALLGPNLKFSVAPIPEPSSLALFATGAIGLIAYRRRKRKQAA